MAGKSKILIIGATGYIGKYLVEASVKAGHPTYALVRKGSISSPEKSEILQSFRSFGVSLLYGDINDLESLASSIKQVDVVISAVGLAQIADQVKIIAAIKEAGNVKRFFPSEFGTDSDFASAVEPAASFFREKSSIRRAIEKDKIPFTYVVSYGFAGYFLVNLGQQNARSPPRDKLVIIGEGNIKAMHVKEEDIAEYTIKAVDDPRTLNRILFLRPPENELSFNELVSLWEKKIGKTLEKTCMLEDQLLQKIKESPYPLNLFLALSHSTFVNGAHGSNVDASNGVEASKLYPEVKYTSISKVKNKEKKKVEERRQRCGFPGALKPDVWEGESSGLGEEETERDEGEWCKGVFSIRGYVGEMK